METLRKNDIQDVATYCGLVLLKEGMTVTPLKLQKILYYVQAWMMVFFNEQLLFDFIRFHNYCLEPSAYIIIFNKYLPTAVITG